MWILLTKRNLRKLISKKVLIFLAMDFELEGIERVGDAKEGRKMHVMARGVEKVIRSLKKRGDAGKGREREGM